MSHPPCARWLDVCMLSTSPPSPNPCSPYTERHKTDALSYHAYLAQILGVDKAAVREQRSRSLEPFQSSALLYNSVNMAALSTSMLGQTNKALPLQLQGRTSSPSLAVRRPRALAVRAAATGPGSPKTKSDIIQTVRQGCDQFLQVTSPPYGHVESPRTPVP